MAYLGERVEVEPLLEELRRNAEKEGFRVEVLAEAGGFPIYAFSRIGKSGGPPIYLSSGIHGDEPAGPVALSELLKTGLPGEVSWKICPVLNPTGLDRGTRESAAGIDLNRDYNHPTQPETIAHIQWLRKQNDFAVSLLLHEDWETTGFYLYEVNPTRKGFSLGRRILDAVETCCPIEPSELIDGNKAINGLIVPDKDVFKREDWPEAFYLLMNQNRLNYTLEAPSSLELEVRVRALKTAVRAASSDFIEGRLQG